MTRANLTSKIQLLILAIVANATILFVKAQKKNPDLKVGTTVNKIENAVSSDWMNTPFVWIIGALILVIIIVLVGRGGKSK
jgi:chromate transport protein ChrA